MESIRGLYIKIAEADLFLDKLLLGYKKINYSLPVWASNRFLKNIVYIFYSLRISIEIIHFYNKGKVVLFGSKLILYFMILDSFGVECDYIMNELPSGRRERIYKVLLKKRRVGVSNQSRVDYLKRTGWQSEFYLVPNLTYLKRSFVREVAETNAREGAVYIGTITLKRVGDELHKFIGKYSTDIYGKVYGSVSGLNIKSYVAQDQLFELLCRYRYGILSYYTDEPNYDLCAPLKLYDYLLSGVIPVSINRNTSFYDLNIQYPNLIAFADSLSNFNFDEHEESRKLFLEDSKNILISNFYERDL